MDNKDRLLADILNAKNMIKMLSDEIDKLEERVYNGSISKENAIKHAESWTNDINTKIKEIDLLIKVLLVK